MVDVADKITAADMRKLRDIFDAAPVPIHDRVILNEGLFDRAALLGIDLAEYVRQPRIPVTPTRNLWKKHHG